MSPNFITIVSGLPRSGTSMMMQVLEAGGLAVLTDNLRKQDEDNPKGYYEYEPVKQTKQDPSWVPGARGKVVKVIYSLLYDLPSGFDYRIIFMQRNLDEVIASQKAMLERSDREGANVSNEKLTEVFTRQLAKFDDWIATQKAFRILKVDHRSNGSMRANQRFARRSTRSRKGCLGSRPQVISKTTRQRVGRRSFLDSFKISIRLKTQLLSFSFYLIPFHTCCWALSQKGDGVF